MKGFSVVGLDRPVLFCEKTFSSSGTLRTSSFAEMFGSRGGGGGGGGSYWNLLGNGKKLDYILYRLVYI